jgi:hypothetical protein
MNPLRDPTMMSGGGHLHDMSHMGGGPQYRAPQMRTSDPAAFGGQQRQDGMSFMSTHPQDMGPQQQQQLGFGNAQNADSNASQGTRLGGRSQRAAAAAARGRSFAAAADPFAYMDDE